MRIQDGSDLTLLLREASSGKQEAFDELVPLVYEQLRRLAHQRLLAQRPDHTLNTTALVHEAYLRIVNVGQSRWQDRAHFFAAAATVMTMPERETPTSEAEAG